MLSVITEVTAVTLTVNDHPVIVVQQSYQQIPVTSGCFQTASVTVDDQSLDFQTAK